MRNRIFSLVVLALFCGWETGHAFQDQEPEKTEVIAKEPAPGEALTRACLVLQARAVDSELHRLDTKLNLDPGLSQSLRKAANREVQSLVDTMSEKSAQLIMSSMKQYLDSRIREFLWEEIESKLPDEKQTAFDELKQSFLRRQQLMDETAINTILVFLDSEFCLSESQIGELRKRYIKSWDSSLNGHCFQLANNGIISGTHGIYAIGKENLSNLLSEPQRQALADLGKYFDQLGKLHQLARTGQYDDSESIREFSLVVMKLKIAEYRQLVDINEQKLKRLEIACKGAASKTVERFDALFRKASDTPMTSKDFSVMREPLVDQCTSEMAWQKTLANVLDEEQLQTIIERESARKALHLENALANFTLMFSEMVSPTIDRDQFLRLTKAIGSQIGDGVAPNCEAILHELPGIPDSVFQEVLTNEQWRMLKPILDRGRRSMREAQE